MEIRKRSPLEILPLKNPDGLAVGDTLPVKIMFEGKPLAGAKLQSTYAGYKADKEKVIHGTLDTILKETKGEKLPFEHLIYVGDFLAKRYKTLD